MGYNLDIVNPIENPKWDDLLLSSEGYSFFHSSFWARTLLESYNFTPRYFARTDENRLSVLVPMMEVNNAPLRKKGVSLPFTDMSDPIIDSHISWHDLYKELAAYGREAGWKSLEIRGDAHVDDDSIPSTDYVSHTLNLSNDENALFKNFSDGTRGNIKKAEREGVKVDVTSSRESLDEFCKLHGATRKRHGLPPQPSSFFASVHKHVLATDNGFVVLARIAGKPVAGAVFFHFGTKAIYKYSASDPAFQNSRPNNLVLWEAIRRYSRNGFTSLCLGRTEPENVGLRHYKSSWGAREDILRYYKYDISQSAFVKDQAQVPAFYTAIFKALPSPVLNALGSLLYKYVA
jgi:CelD/BcsL family acetyltransferase involved in cellulose biosynthesis